MVKYALKHFHIFRGPSCIDRFSTEARDNISFKDDDGNGGR